MAVRKARADLEKAEDTRVGQQKTAELDLGSSASPCRR
jgi:hypothetical protein